MSPVTVVESGLTFGPFPDPDCYVVERSGLCDSLQPGVKMVEFIVLRPTSNGGRAAWCVEAKTSIAHPINTRDKFAVQIQAIGEKMRNALLVLLAIHVGRHPSYAHEVPAGFCTLDLRSDSVRFVLVINGYPREWLQPIQDALAQTMEPIRRTFGLPPTSVAVLNDSGARRFGLTG
jgi:hypothetical protein